MKEYLSDITEVLSANETTRNGLTEAQVNAKIEKYGKNQLKGEKKRSMFLRIWDQINDPMILVLIGAAVISGVFKEYSDMVIIGIVIILNAVLGIFQESKAEKAIEALKKMSAPQSKVRRNGNVVVLKSEDVVPGDIVLIEAGDSVPADMRLIVSASLKIEEAALTGESVPAEKDDKTITAKDDKDIPLGDRHNMAYMGTNVTYGRGEGVVTGTGMNTEMGKIANILSNTENEKTPLQIKLAQLSKVLSIAVLGICIFIFFFNVIRGGGFEGEHVFEAFLTAVSLAVAAIPEGLVVVVTVLLSIGVTRMSAKNSIIRRLTAVETLGCTQIICSDKTGTLTQNKMTVTEHFGDELMLSSAMILCCDAKKDADGKYVGDPTEIGLIEFAVRCGREELIEKMPRVGEAPFDSVRKMMSTIHKISDANSSAVSFRQFTKGAPDEVLKNSTHIIKNGEVKPLSDDDRKEIAKLYKQMADKALRALAGAYREYTTIPDDLAPAALENNLIFAGVCGMIDPIRPEVKAAIGGCKHAGIKAIMITGDHKDTAVAIAKELGMITDVSEAMTGAELSELSDEEFEKRITKTAVYARVQPEHKVRIVTMWKKIGKITAMTGDGVNDAPAIKSADIGVGMGITGTDVTKNVADMVLTDDNFASIVYAVEEGRRIYENIRKAVQFLLASNLSEVVSIFIATLIGKTLFAPIHVLWINLITDTFPAMALGMENAEADSMKKPPRDKNESIFAGGLGTGVLFQGVLIAILTLLSFFTGLKNSPETGMSMAFVTLSLCEVFHAFNMRSRTKSIFSVKGVNKFLLGAMLLSFVLTFAVMYIPGLNDVFRLEMLSVQNLLIAGGISVSVIPIVEVEKLVRRKIKK